MNKASFAVSLAALSLGASLPAAPAAAAPPAAAEPAAPPPIVVTGVRIDDARRQLEACIARHCPTLEDIQATLQYAEALFMSGDYRRARATLKSSIGRNRSAAPQHPVAVAGLYRANARMAIHEGDGDDFRMSTYDVEHSLHAGLPRSDPRILGARLETADMHVSLHESDAAEQLYDAVARDAGAIGRPDIAAVANLRHAMLAYHLKRTDARARLEAIARLDGPQTRMLQLAARIALARIDKDKGDGKAMDRLVAELAAQHVRAPVLLYAPAIGVPTAATTSGFANVGGDAVEMRNMSTMMATDSFDYWADVGYWIGPDGHVSDVSVLRSRGPTFWLTPVLASVSSRLYAASGEAGAPAYRVERYRYTSLIERASDTRIKSHSAQGRIEMLDITAAPPGG